VEMGKRPKMPRPPSPPPPLGDAQALPLPSVDDIVEKCTTNKDVRNFMYYGGDWALDPDIDAPRDAAEAEDLSAWFTGGNEPTTSSASRTIDTLDQSSADGGGGDKLVEAVGAVFHGKQHATRVETRAAIFKDISLLDNTSIPGAEEVGVLAGEKPDERVVPSSYFIAPTKEDIEFVLLDGGPLSGKKEAAAALTEALSEYVHLIEPEALV